MASLTACIMPGPMTIRGARGAALLRGFTRLSGTDGSDQTNSVRATKQPAPSGRGMNGCMPNRPFTERMPKPITMALTSWPKANKRKAA